MSAPFMPLYVGDYLRDTRGLTAEQHGAYLLLLMSLWNAGGELPDDDRKLARFASCTPSRWAKIRPELIVYFEVADGVVRHKRLSMELEKAQEKSIKRAESGSLGGKAKALKSKESEAANADDLPPGLLCHSSEPEPEKKTPTDVGVKRASAPPAKPRATRASRIPADWTPNEALIAFAAEQGADRGQAERSLASFHDHFLGSGGTKVDWTATAKNWIRRDAERGLYGRGPPGPQARLALVSAAGQPHDLARHARPYSADRPQRAGPHDAFAAAMAEVSSRRDDR